MALAVGHGNGSASGAEQPAPAETYRQAKDFLAHHTSVVELTNDQGARVAVCPQWQGRVMTSTCDGLDGPSFGFINRAFIEAGREDPHFNNKGAEDRLWLVAGRRHVQSLVQAWSRADVRQLVHPAGIQSRAVRGCGRAGRLAVPHEPAHEAKEHGRHRVRPHGHARCPAARCVRFAARFGSRCAKIVSRPGVKMVAYETVNTITNQGPAMSKEKGLVSIWILSMLNASPKTVIVVPYRAGAESELGPVVKSDYFGTVPPERLKITPEAILFSADANYRSKIGTSQQRAKNILGAVDFQNGVLTLAQFTMPDDPAKVDYLNSMWGLPQAHPYSGDVANAYNDGPLAPGKPGMGNFCEIESLSPALALKTGESLSHHHRTIHIRADRQTLAELARQTLGVDLESARQEMVIGR